MNDAAALFAANGTTNETCAIPGTLLDDVKFEVLGNGTIQIASDSTGDLDDLEYSGYTFDGGIIDGSMAECNATN
jgi:hypothetical protein